MLTDGVLASVERLALVVCLGRRPGMDNGAKTFKLVIKPV